MKRNLVVSIAFRVIVCAALLLTAFMAVAFLTSTRPSPQTTSRDLAPPRVMVMQASPVPVRRQWEGFGTAVAVDAADVPARVTATVIDKPLNIRAGVRVQKGQLLVQLDQSDFARQVEMATQAIADIQAQLTRLELEAESWARRVELAVEDVRLARAEFQRVQDAFNNGAANQRELDQARQAVLTAERNEVQARESLDTIQPRRSSLQAQRLREDASLRLAKLNLERSTIVSPLDGVLESVEIEVGENVMAGERIARVVNLEKIEVPLLLPAAARHSVALGDVVKLHQVAGGGRAWQAIITRMSPTNDQATRTIRVYTELEQTPGDENGNLLAPGMYVRGVVVSGQQQVRWVVPRRAVIGERVLLIEQGLVKSRGIDVDFQVQGDFPSLGLSDQDWIVLKDALPEQSLVVVEGSRALAEGAAVTAVPAGQVASDGEQDEFNRQQSTRPRRFERDSPARDLDCSGFQLFDDNQEVVS